jgi:hypothetical protein
MKRSMQNFYALLHMLDSSRARAKPRSPAQAAAAGIVRHEINPVIRAAFETYPELDVEEILERCTPALTEVLLRALER